MPEPGDHEAPSESAKVNDWVAAFQRGDTAAFEAIVRTLQHQIVTYLCRRYALNAQQACDITQETMLAAWTQLRSGPAPADAKAWLFGIARHNAADAIRRDRHEILAADVPVDANQTNHDSYAQLAPFWEIEDAVDRQNAARRYLPRLLPLVEDALHSMPPRLSQTITTRAEVLRTICFDSDRKAKGATLDALVDLLSVNRAEASRLLCEASTSMRRTAGVLLMAASQRRRCSGLDQHLGKEGWQHGPLNENLRRRVLQHAATCQTCKHAHQQAMLRISRLPLAVVALALGLDEDRRKMLADLFDGGEAVAGVATAVAQRPWSAPRLPDLIAAMTARVVTLPGVQTLVTAAMGLPRAAQAAGIAVAALAGTTALVLTVQESPAAPPTTTIAPAPATGSDPASPWPSGSQDPTALESSSAAQPSGSFWSSFTAQPTDAPGPVVGPTTAPPTTPPPPPPPLTVVSVAGGFGHTCAVRSDSALFCWGANTYGQIGNGTNTTVATAQRLDGTWKSVAAGTGLLYSPGYYTAANGGQTCGIRTDDSLWCWGLNDLGQVGIGNTANQNGPSRVGTATWSSIDLGAHHSCGIQTSGTLWCWGGNQWGQLGIGSTANQSTPVPVGTGTWKSVSAGGTHTCAIASDGTLWCWGDNSYGQTGNAGPITQRTPARVGTDKWKAIRTGGMHTCAIRTDNTLWCWGKDVSLQLGDPAGRFGSNPTPRQLSPVPMQLVGFDLSDDSTAILDATGHIWWAGDNGGLGRSTDIKTWTAVVLGRDHGCYTAADGSLWCAGANDTGQIGNGRIGGSFAGFEKVVGLLP